MAIEAILVFPDEPFVPDIIDLQSWMSTCKDPTVSAVWQATRYLSAPYRVWLECWRNAGRPDITMPAPNG